MVGIFSSHHQLQRLYLQASDSDQRMTGEPVVSMHNTFMIELVFKAFLSSGLFRQDCSISSILIINNFNYYD
jgi:hypothetical protein